MRSIYVQFISMHRGIMWFCDALTTKRILSIIYCSRENISIGCLLILLRDFIHNLPNILWRRKMLDLSFQIDASSCHWTIFHSIPTDHHPYLMAFRPFINTYGTLSPSQTMQWTSPHHPSTRYNQHLNWG